MPLPSRIRNRGSSAPFRYLALALFPLALIVLITMSGWRALEAPKQFGVQSRLAEATRTQRTIAQASEGTLATQERVSAGFGKLPLYFVENRGQLDGQVAYYVQGRDTSLYFTQSGVTFSLTRTKDAGAEEDPEARLRPVSLRNSESRRTGSSAARSRRWAVKLDFLGANPDARLVAEDPTSAVVSYFKGQKQDWKAGLATYSKVVYKDLWPGIDLVYSGTVNRLKYDFIIQPGAMPEQIQLAYRGATSVSVNEAGELEISTPAGGLKDAKPYAYQEIDGRRVEVTTSYDLGGDAHEYGFRLGQFDRSRPLVVDPVVLVYAGYIGGGSSGTAIAVDTAGNAYIAGTTVDPATFPAIVGPDLSFNGGDPSAKEATDAFVAKVNAAGTALVYAGYIGGSGNEYASGIAVDTAGNAYVTGYTSSTESSFPVTVGPDLTHNGGYDDAFVAKVNAAGTALVYAGYIGGSGSDSGYGIAVDAMGNAYVTGSTDSSEATFPVTVGPVRTYNGSTDAFVAKVNVAGTALVYAGYIGGSSGEIGSGIAVDWEGNAYVTGWTGSKEDTFPVTVGPNLTFHDPGKFALAGFDDAFVAKVNAAGTALLYAGYIGGSLDDFGTAIAVDSVGNAYVTGYTYSTEASFPVTIGPDLTYNGASDAFVAKVNAAGTGLVYAGYIGGSGDDVGMGIAVDAAGNAYVTGGTNSTEATFPVAVGPDLTYNGNGDAFVVKLNSTGTAFLYAGYIGGSGGDAGFAIALDRVGNAYITGQTASSEATFPVTVGPDLTYNGASDAFVAKILNPAFGSKNSASYVPDVLAPDMIAFGEVADIAPELIVAPDGPWPPSLGGVSLEITDSQDRKFTAPIYYVTTNAIGYLIPAGIARGLATVKLTTSTGATIFGTFEIAQASPGLYSANASGSGVPAGFWIRAAANGAQTQGYLFDPSQAVGSRAPLPVDLGAPTDQVYLSLYGTGFRGATQATATVGGVAVTVAGFAAVGIYQGEDVVNIGPLPRALAGQGLVSVVVNFDGKPANTVTVSIR